MFLKKANKAELLLCCFWYLVGWPRHGVCMSHLQEKMSEFDAGNIGVSLTQVLSDAN